MTIVHLPLRTVSEANVRQHWAEKAKRAKMQRKHAWALTPAHGLPVVVTLTRIAPKALDDDNLRTALKAIRDGVADRLGVPDNDPRVSWQYGQRKGAYAVEVALEAA